MADGAQPPTSPCMDSGRQLEMPWECDEAGKEGERETLNAVVEKRAGVHGDI